MNLPTLKLSHLFLGGLVLVFSLGIVFKLGLFSSIKSLAAPPDGISSNLYMADLNENGYIDYIQIDIANTEEDTWSLVGAAPYGFSVTQNGNPITISSVDVIFNDPGFALIVLSITLDESDPDLVLTTDGVDEEEVELIYTQGTGDETCINCVRDNTDDELNAIASGDTDAHDTELDLALPLPLESRYVDANGDGTIDALEVEFSEDVAYTPCDVGDWTLTAGDLPWTSPDASCAGYGVSGHVLSLGIGGSIDPSTGVGGGAEPTIEYTGTTIEEPDAIYPDPVDLFGPLTMVDGADPVALSVSPGDGAVQVSRLSDIVVTFSEAMDTSGFEEGTEFAIATDPGAFSAAWSAGDTVVTLDSASSFIGGRMYTVSLNDTEIENAALAQTLNLDGAFDGMWSFRVQASGDTGSDTGGEGGVSSNETVSTTPVVDLEYPNGESVAITGTNFAITWETSDMFIRTVRLDLSLDNGTTWNLLADDLDEDDGVYWWTVPSVISNNALVRITAQDSGKGSVATDTSDPFVIQAEEVPEELPPEELPPAISDEELGITQDKAGHRRAPGSGVYGVSPYDGSTEEISVVKSGWYVRSFNFSTVYYVTPDGQRRPFWDPQAYFTYTDTWHDIVWVTDATLQTLPLGDPMLPKPRVVLVKIMTDDRVYATEPNEDATVFFLRHLTDESVATEMYGEFWADYVIDVDSTLFRAYEEGTPILRAESIDTTLMKTRQSIAHTVEMAKALFFL